MLTTFNTCCLFTSNVDMCMFQVLEKMCSFKYFHKQFLGVTFNFRKMCVLGLVFSITSFSELVPKLLDLQECVLTYRFSLDHMEQFFNILGGSGSFHFLICFKSHGFKGLLYVTNAMIL